MHIKLVQRNKTSVRKCNQELHKKIIKINAILNVLKRLNEYKFYHEYQSPRPWLTVIY